jgi:hypothetical protein
VRRIVTVRATQADRVWADIDHEILLPDSAGQRDQDPITPPNSHGMPPEFGQHAPAMARSRSQWRGRTRQILMLVGPLPCSSRYTGPSCVLPIREGASPARDWVLCEDGYTKSPTSTLSSNRTLVPTRNIGSEAHMRISGQGSKDACEYTHGA